MALGTPQLWRVLIINDITPYNLVAEFLERSKAAPLDISVEFSHACSEDLFDNVASLLRKNVHRWHTFEWRSSKSGHLANKLFERPVGRAPLLEELTLGDAIYMTNQLFEPFGLIGATPRLRVLELWSVSLDWRYHSFENLTRIELVHLPRGRSTYSRLPKMT